MLDMMNYLVDQRYVAPLNNTKQANFEGGNGAMMLHSSPASRFVKIPDLKNVYDLVSFPLIGENPKIGTGVPGYAISADTENRDIAWLFLSYLLSKDGQNALALGGSSVPPIRIDMSDPSVNDWGKGYESYNMAAYTWGPQYNQNTDFFLTFDGKYQTDLIFAVSDMITNKLTRPNGPTNDRVIDKCIEAIEDVLAS